jgi:hypothetical protein
MRIVSKRPSKPATTRRVRGHARRIAALEQTVSQLRRTVRQMTKDVAWLSECSSSVPKAS